MQNHPNPFSSNTHIDYTLAKSGNVTLSIFNVNGELVRTIQNGHQVAGNYSIDWNGLNNSGNPAHSGVYFYRLQTEGFTATQKMFMLR
jgi:flagellar hook assembly protein FlgD